MKVPVKDKYRLQDKVDLVLKVNYSSSLFALLFGIVCLLFLNIEGIIPYTFFGFGIFKVRRL